MLYNRLDHDELERAVYIDPTNIAARDKMLRRTTALMDTRSDEYQEIEMELENARKEHASEIEDFEGALTEEQIRSARLSNDLAKANDRIADLTRAKDLV